MDSSRAYECFSDVCLCVQILHRVQELKSSIHTLLQLDFDTSVV